MPYEHRRMGRQKVRYNSDNDDNPLTYQLVVDGAKVTPTSATIEIFSPVSTTAIVAATAMTVSGSLLTYSPTTTTTADWPNDTSYRADIIVTYNSLTYDRTIMFDVVKYLLDLNIGHDQLIALDDSIQGMQHNGDADFNALIDACSDVMRAKIEARVLGDGKLLENMILDSSPVATAARFYMLGQIAREKKDFETHESYMTDFEKLFNSVLSTIRYDEAEDGHEPEEIGGLVRSRLVM